MWTKIRKSRTIANRIRMRSRTTVARAPLVVPRACAFICYPYRLLCIPGIVVLNSSYSHSQVAPPRFLPPHTLPQPPPFLLRGPTRRIGPSLRRRSRRRRRWRRGLCPPPPGPSRGSKRRRRGRPPCRGERRRPWRRGRPLALFLLLLGSRRGPRVPRPRGLRATGAGAALPPLMMC